MNNKTEVVKPKSIRKRAVKADLPATPENMIMTALNQGMTPEVIEKLVSLKERLERSEAEKAFREAMAKFQAECPIIIKSNKVDYTSSGTRVKWQYASLDAIVLKVRKPLQNNGFSYSFTSEQTEKTYTSICHVYHKLGHTELSSYKIDIDTASKMNEAQKTGTAKMYANRGSFCNAFGILTSEPDTDMNDPDAIKKKAEAEQKAKEAKEQLVKFLKDNEYLKEGFEILKYTDRAQWAFCNGNKWNSEQIKAHLNLLVDKQNGK